jgi:predicted nuclease with TOPRIM domain
MTTIYSIRENLFVIKNDVVMIIKNNPQDIKKIDELTAMKSNLEQIKKKLNELGSQLGKIFLTGELENAKLEISAVINQDLADLESGKSQLLSVLFHKEERLRLLNLILNHINNFIEAIDSALIKSNTKN